MNILRKILLYAVFIIVYNMGCTAYSVLSEPDIVSSETQQLDDNYKENVKLNNYARNTIYFCPIVLFGFILFSGDIKKCLKQQ